MAAIDKLIVKLKNGRKTASIPCLEIMGDYYAHALPALGTTFNEILGSMHQETLNIFRAKDPTLTMPTNSAFNNCNGKWTEYVFAAFAWNTLAKINRTDPDNWYIYVKMPTNSSSDNEWIALLAPAYLDHLSSFSKDRTHPKVASTHHNALLLSSSNPDAVILKFPKAVFTGFQVSPETDLEDLSINTITMLDSVFPKLVGKVIPFDNLCCFLSMKNSMRPDRRYQFVHEGDNVKAILLYLIGRQLDNRLEISFLQNKFFGLSFQAVNDNDIRAMDTAMVACLTTPSMDPIWSVDQLFPCLTTDSVDHIISSVLH